MKAARDMKSNQNDVTAEVIKALKIETNALEGYIGKLESSQTHSTQLYSAILQLQNTLSSGGKIIVTGVGKSGKIAQKIAATLSSTGSLALFLHPTEGLHGDIGMIRPEDCVMAISYTGNTEELIQLLPSIQNKKIPIIALTGFETSGLATRSNHWLDISVPAEACPHNLAPTASTTLTLALGDAIAVALMKLRGFHPEDFAINHPGGSLGKKLNLKVKDVMHKGNQLAIAKPNTPVDEILTNSTEKKLGGVLVIENEKLLGIITDGDIRRALKFKEKFFTFLASDLMTTAPTTTTEEELAFNALALMQNRKSQISVLPVLDANQKPVGLVRVHDLIKTF